MRIRFTRFRGALLFLLICACGSPKLSRTRPHMDIPLLIRRSTGVPVRPAGGVAGMETSYFSRPDLRPELQRICMHWPLSTNRINSSFGRRFDRKHEGLDLRAPRGTEVDSVLPGAVIYAGEEVRGYGLLVLVKHPLGLTTAYAHLSKILVQPGQEVQAGEPIALSGNTGHTSGPHLHFEVRDGTRAIDPLQFLPAASDLRGVGKSRLPHPVRRTCS